MRIQLDIPEQDAKELLLLMKDLEIEAFKDLFNNALTMLNWATKEVKDGRSIASIDEGNLNYKELLMPIFEKIKKGAPTDATKNAVDMASSDDTKT